MVCCSSLIRNTSGGFVSWASDRPVGVCSMRAVDQSFLVCGDSPINKSRSGWLQTRLLLCYSKICDSCCPCHLAVNILKTSWHWENVLLQEDYEMNISLLNITGRDFRTGSCQLIMHVVSQFRQLESHFDLYCLTFILITVFLNCLGTFSKQS